MAKFKAPPGSTLNSTGYAQARQVVQRNGDQGNASDGERREAKPLEENDFQCDARAVGTQVWTSRHRLESGDGMPFAAGAAGPLQIMRPGSDERERHTLS